MIQSWMQAVKMTKTTRYDVAQHLRSAEEMALYLEACLAEAGGDTAFFVKALSNVARAEAAASPMERFYRTRVD
jgi:DNA-binding phage protein